MTNDPQLRALLKMREVEERTERPDLYTDPEAERRQRLEAQVEAGKQIEELSPERLQMLLEADARGEVIHPGQGALFVARQMQKAQGYVVPPQAGTHPVVDPEDKHGFIGHAGKPGKCAVCGKGLGHDLHLVGDPQGRDHVTGPEADERDHIQ